jgi:mannosyl-3-phosphoglycerate synthase
MVIGVLLAKYYHKNYVGFIDSDNYVPGAVNEYVKIFAAGFGMSNTPYCNIRISWVFKPKIKDNSLKFSKWGRISEVTNRHLNTVLSYFTGFETDIIKTGNSGEHALSMQLAECLNFSSGYSVEPYEFIDIFEKFGGIIPTKYPEAMNRGVEIFQIETRNPHFHENKGESHLNEMMHGSLVSISTSPICPQNLKSELKEQLKEYKTNAPEEKKKKPEKSYSLIKMAPLKDMPITELADFLERSPTMQKYNLAK